MSKKRSKEQIEHDNATRTKVCTGCNKRLSFDEFNYSKSTIDKLKTRCIECASKSTKRWRNNQVDMKIRNRGYALKANYGITHDDYEKMLADQEGKCAICGSTNGGGRDIVTHFFVDHCHTTGKVRGLLCHSCNTAIGLLKDDTELLMKAMKYLER